MPDMPAYDWSRFLKRIDIRADPQAIYRSWSTAEGLEKWFLRKSVFTDQQHNTRPPDQQVQPGDKYAWLWYGYDDDTVEHGTILEADGATRLKFTFGKAGNVTISTKKEQGETIPELLQENIPVDEPSKVYFHVGCTKGWVFYLANLKSILEGGIDLRNKNLLLKNMINA